MDLRVGDSQRFKRKVRSVEDDKWECTVCTYINPSESYKCEVCGMRKGTSTRKPKLNPQVVEQQQLIAQAILKDKDDDHRKRKDPKQSSAKLGVASLRWNSVDRSSPLLFKVFANGYSVVITEFQLKPKAKSRNSLDSPATSNCSSLQSFTGVCGAHSEQLSPSDSIHTSSDRNGNPETFAEYDLGDSVELKAPRTSNVKTAVNATTSFDTIPRSRSSASSSAGCNNLPSNYSSTPNSRHHSPVQVKPESQQEKNELEPLARDSGGQNIDRKPTSDRLVGKYRGKKKTNIATHRLQPVCTASDSATVSSIDDEDIKPSKGNRNHPTTGSELPKTRENKSLKRRCQRDNSRTAADLSFRRKRTKTFRRKKPLTPSDKTCLNSSTESTSSASVTPSPSWSTADESRDSKALSLRISVTNSMQSNPKYSDATPSRDQSPPVKKRQQTGSSQRTGLKCKIRVLHSSSPEEPDARVITFSTSPTASVGDQKEFDETSELCANSVRCPVLDSSSATTESTAATFQLRLSTESKNTSAMTDSSGANALEISH